MRNLIKISLMGIMCLIILTNTNVLSFAEFESEDSEAALNWLIGEEVGREDFEVTSYEDFDRDGIYELFALVPAGETELGVVAYEVWFASPYVVQKLGPAHYYTGIGTMSGYDSDEMTFTAMVYDEKAETFGSCDWKVVDSRPEEICFAEGEVGSGWGRTTELPQNYFTTDGYKYIIRDDGTAEIVECTIECSSGKDKIVIPEKLDGYTVTTIGVEAFKEQYYLKEVEMPDTILEIKENAFYGIGLLRRIKLSNNLKIIGDGAFCCCSALNTIRIPGSVETIGNAAFSSCEQLISVEICDGVRELGSEMFRWCLSLKEIKIPASVEMAGNWFVSQSANTKIVGVEGSYAQELADEYDLSFEVMTVEEKPAQEEASWEDLQADPIPEEPKETSVSSEQQSFMDWLNASTPEPELTVAPTATPNAVRTTAPQSNMMYNRVFATGDVYVRSGPARSYNTLGVLKKGASAAYMQESAADERGVMWYKVNHNGIVGWVSSMYSQLQ